MKSNIQKISRAAVCLVLVCCLIVNISPVKARAVDPATAVAFDFAARSVIASAMQGLGVSKGSDPTVFDGIVNSAVDALSTATNFISDGFAKVARFNSSSGATSFFFPLALVQSIFDWLFDVGEVLSTDTNCLSYNGNTYSFSNSASYKFASNSYSLTSDVPFVLYSVVLYGDIPANPGHPYHAFSFAVCSASSATLRIVSRSSSYNVYTRFSNGSLSICSLNTWMCKANLDSYYTDCSGLVDLGVVDIGTTDSSVFYEQFLADASLADGSVATSHDLTLTNVGASGQTVEEAYPSWAENTVSVPGSVYGSDDDYVPSVPIAVAPDYEGTTNISQSDVQAGNSTWVDTETDTDIGTDTSPEALAGTVAGTIAWDFISGLFDVFVPGFELISNTIEGIGALIKALPQTLKDVFGIDSLLEKISAIYETVVQGFIETAAGIKSLPQAIADALSAIFVPSADYITAKVEAIRAKFPFMDSIIATGEYIRDSLSGASGPPAIYVDLTLADGDIDYGEKTLLTDFSWYAPYKGTVDSVLGAALWAFFGWRVFLRLPGLISGADGYVGEIRTLSSRSSGAGGRKKED